MPSTSFKDETMLRVFSFIALFFPLSSMASMYMENSCQQRHEGIAVSVEDIDKVDHLMAKVKVKLELTYSDSPERYLEFKHLKHALVQIKEGREYIIGMNKGKLCLVEEIK